MTHQLLVGLSIGANIYFRRVYNTAWYRGVDYASTKAITVNIQSRAPQASSSSIKTLKKNIIK